MEVSAVKYKNSSTSGRPDSFMMFWNCRYKEITVVTLNYCDSYCSISWRYFQSGNKLSRIERASDTPSGEVCHVKVLVCSYRARKKLCLYIWKDRINQILICFCRDLNICFLGWQRHITKITWVEGWYS